MPMNTEILRHGRSRRVAWNAWTLNRLYEAMLDENDGDEEKVSYWPERYTFRQDHTFSSPENIVFLDGDPEDIHTFKIFSGDLYQTFRSSR
ncbi:hypothetical protein LCGC14_0381970 [marine sediment metagenome]|uniref:Uncharacterized protein n=1 Tax=marine sediment metagenome TaxID=412755 RepID=A0A0F9T1Z8_9ZZZZ